MLLVAGMPSRASGAPSFPADPALQTAITQSDENFCGPPPVLQQEQGEASSDASDGDECRETDADKATDDKPPADAVQAEDSKESDAESANAEETGVSMSAAELVRAATQASSFARLSERPTLWLGRRQPSSRPLGFVRGDQRRVELDGEGGATASELLRCDGESHMLTFAPTGTGKTRGALIPNLLQWPGGAVVVDVKQAELCRVTARRRREMGQDVIVLDPFGVTGLPSGSLNPLEIFSLPFASIEADAESVAAVFAGQGALSKDPFWDIQGTSVLAAVLAYVATLSPEKRTVSKVTSMLFGDDVIYNLAVMLDTVGKEMPPMAYRDIAALLAMPDVTRGGVLATTQSYLKSLHSPPVLKSLDSTSFSLVDFILGKPATIYLVLPIERVQSHRALLKLWIGTLLRCMVSRSFLAEKPTLFMLDECGQLGAFPFLETFITLCRSYSCRVWACFQDLAQLQASYPATWKTILNNCGVQAFGFLNRSLAEQWSGYFDSGPATLRALGAHEQVVLTPGRPEQRVSRLDYLRDSEFVGQWDANPLYAPASATPFGARVEPATQAVVRDLPEAEKRSSKKQTSSGTGNGGLTV
jgi:type IV secretion system protein VirD4